MKGRMSGDARDFNNMETRAVIKFFSCKARSRRKFTPFWKKHYRNTHHRMPPSKTGWPCLNMVSFPLVMRLVLDDPKQWPPRDYWLNSRANLGRPPDFGWVNSWTTGHLTWAGWVYHSWRFGHAESLREVGPEMPERESNMSKMPVVWATFGISSARSRWFPVAIGDRERNLVISL